MLGTYRLLPEGLLLPLALIISLSELYLAVRLLGPGKKWRFAVVTAAIHTGYLFLALVTLYRGIELANCGCFGVFLARPLTWMTPVEDGIIVAISVAYVWLTKETSK